MCVQFGCSQDLSYNLGLIQGRRATTMIGQVQFDNVPRFNHPPGRIHPKEHRAPQGRKQCLVVFTHSLGCSTVGQYSNTFCTVALNNSASSGYVCTKFNSLSFQYFFLKILVYIFKFNSTWYTKDFSKKLKNAQVRVCTVAPQVQRYYSMIQYTPRWSKLIHRLWSNIFDPKLDKSATISIKFSAR